MKVQWQVTTLARLELQFLGPSAENTGIRANIYVVVIVENACQLHALSALRALVDRLLRRAIGIGHFG